MKKIVLLLLTTLILTGCTVVRMDTSNPDVIIDIVLSKPNTLYNTVGKGYKYYKPRGVIYLDTNELNDKLYSNGNYYYLYVDVISYYYKKDVEYEENKDAYYSRIIDFDGRNGYVEINKVGDKYLVEFMYNYSKIESMVDEEDINEVILNSSYILSTIKYNAKVIKIMLNDDFLTNQEEKYDIFTPKKKINDFVEFVNDGNEEWGDYNEFFKYCNE